MFNRNGYRATPTGATPPVRNVRLLETEEELRVAVERAMEYERARSHQGGARFLTYERYWNERPAELAEVVSSESSGVGD